MNRRGFLRLASGLVVATVAMPQLEFDEPLRRFWPGWSAGAAGTSEGAWGPWIVVNEPVLYRTRELVLDENRLLQQFDFPIDPINEVPWSWSRLKLRPLNPVEILAARLSA